MKALVYHGPGQRGWDSVSGPSIVDSTDAVVRIDTNALKVVLQGSEGHRTETERAGAPVAVSSARARCSGAPHQ
jgi:hypothetical protein